MNIQSLLQHLIFCSAVMTVLSLCWLFAAKRLFHVQSAHWRFLPWWALGIGFLTPYKPHFGSTLISAATAESPFNSPYAPVNASNRLVFLLFAVWLGGMLLSLFRLIRGEIAMHKSIRRLGMPLSVSEETALNLVSIELGVDRELRAVRLPFLQSPMLTGLLSPVILLPSDQSYSMAELQLIFRHELTHLKRGDLLSRLLWLLVHAVHWFNPAVSRIMRFVDSECEVACDEDAMRGQTDEQRADYCDLIVQTAARRRKGFRGGLATNFTCSGAALHRRIRTILAARRGRRIAALVLVIALLTVLTGKLFGDKSGEFHIEREPEVQNGSAVYEVTTSVADDRKSVTEPAYYATTAHEQFSTSVLPVTTEPIPLF